MSPRKLSLLTLLDRKNLAKKYGVVQISVAPAIKKYRVFSDCRVRRTIVERRVLICGIFAKIFGRYLWQFDGLSYGSTRQK